jgi:hypothetical protein
MFSHFTPHCVNVFFRHLFKSYSHPGPFRVGQPFQAVGSGRFPTPRSEFWCKRERDGKGDYDYDYDYEGKTKVAAYKEAL